MTVTGLAAGALALLPLPLFLLPIARNAPCVADHVGANWLDALAFERVVGYRLAGMHV